MSSACLCVAAPQAEVAALRSELQSVAQRQKEVEGRVAAAAAAAVSAASRATLAAVDKVRQASAGPAMLVCPALPTKTVICFALRCDDRDVCMWALRVSTYDGALSPHVRASACMPTLSRNRHTCRVHTEQQPSSPVPCYRIGGDSLGKAANLPHD